MDGLRAARVQGTPRPDGTSLVWHSADPLTEPVESPSSPSPMSSPCTPVSAQPLHPKVPPATRGSSRCLGVCHIPAPPVLSELPSVCPGVRCPGGAPGSPRAEPRERREIQTAGGATGATAAMEGVGLGRCE